jgi:hypothetical protein
MRVQSSVVGGAEALPVPKQSNVALIGIALGAVAVLVVVAALLLR